MADEIKAPIQMGQKEQIIRQWYLGKFGTVKADGNARSLFTDFQVDLPQEKLSYGLFNGVLKKIENNIENNRPIWEGEIDVVVERHKKLVVNAVNLDDLEYPEFKLFRSGKYIDHLISEDTEEGGLYSGTGTIVIGESGVGKTTVLLDLLASIKEITPESKVLYLSSEMTKNDLFFYRKKTPMIGKVPTVLLMDYIENGIVKVIENLFFESEYDVIVLDSYQDVIVKLCDVFGMRAKQAEAWLTGAIIKACEDHGKSIFAIQHLTKGGTYVGSTYLKHATTAMMELRKDTAGGRYVMYSKNRRGGSLVDYKLYYSLVDGAVRYDELSFRSSEQAHELKDKEMANRQKYTEDFANIFEGIGRSTENPTGPGDGITDVEFEEVIEPRKDGETPIVEVVPGS